MQEEKPVPNAKPRLSALASTILNEDRSKDLSRFKAAFGTQYVQEVIRAHQLYLSFHAVADEEQDVQQLSRHLQAACSFGSTSLGMTSSQQEALSKLLARTAIDVVVTTEGSAGSTLLASGIVNKPSDLELLLAQARQYVASWDRLPLWSRHDTPPDDPRRSVVDETERVRTVGFRDDVRNLTVRLEMYSTDFEGQPHPVSASKSRTIADLRTTPFRSEQLSGDDGLAPNDRSAGLVKIDLNLISP